MRSPACSRAATGLPVGDIVLATNENQVLPDFFATGEYGPRQSIATLATAMDVGDPGNFERLRWLYADDATLRKALSAQSVDDDEIRDEIRSSRARYGVVVCPHTATATRVLSRLRERGETRDFVAVATAHPAKFEAIVEPLAGPNRNSALAQGAARPADVERAARGRLWRAPRKAARDRSLTRAAANGAIARTFGDSRILLYYPRPRVGR